MEPAGAGGVGGLLAGGEGEGEGGGGCEGGYEEEEGEEGGERGHGWCFFGGVELGEVGFGFW